MAPLPTDLRKILENAVVDARRKAEAGAGAVLTNLAVFASQPYASMDGSARRLRVALRARASALGDGYGDLDKGKAPLSEEIAYEAWHRMLFARFLAENELLMHESGAPLSIDLCDELAREERTQRGNTVDAWDIAARYASDMLPGIFKADDPSSRAAARFAPEDHIALERIVTGLPADVFTADDSLGWIYQFWQREAKNEVNASERKIGGKDLAPVTQLFTEHYMVRFLLENSLGAWWAARHPDSPLIATFDYLRFREDGTPAAGTFPGWPERAAEVTVMDPCCGSGHFLVAAFEMLRRMRMEEEGLDEVAAGDAVLRDNLFGLELDPRCTQIAAFALAFATWKAGGYRELPLPHVACSGIAVTGQLDAWRKLARGDFKLTSALERLYNLFRDASTLGSLIDPNAIPIEDRMFTAEFDQVAPFLERALARERSAEDPTSAVFGEAALGVVQAAELLAGRYTLVATNVPYLSRGSHDEMLRTFIDTHFPASKADLATVFVERCRAFTRDDGQGSYAVVTPQNWLFLTSYRKLREKLLHEQEWDSVTRLGEGGFESHAAAGAFTVLLILTNQWPNADHLMTGIDASEPRMVAEKAMFMRDAELQVLSQEAQLRNPGEVFSFTTIDSSQLLSEYAYCYQGISTGDSSRLVINFWEIPAVKTKWRYFQVPPERTSTFAGRNCIVDWGTLQEGFAGSAIRGLEAREKSGIAIGQMRGLPATLYQGTLFSNSTPVIIPNNNDHLAAIWSFCQSSEFHSLLRQINPKVSVDNGYVSKVPFNLLQWQTAADNQYPNGLPEPYSNDPTQWLFKGHPKDSTAPLQVAVARLLGYCWPEQSEGDGLEQFEDADGIVPLGAVAGERSAAERLRELLAAAWGVGWSPTVEARLLTEVGYANRTLDDWVMNGFFEQHVSLFHNRPFIWHIWDGLKDGFSVLVNYHKLDGSKLDRLIYSYLGPWISQQRAARDADVPGADVRLVAALELERKLKLIRAGEQPYDIYVRWKQPHEQPIGWEPDLNDGVRLNIRPWIEPFGKPSNSPLRAKVNAKWGKDRGMNPDGSERINDIHLTLEDKRAARDALKSGGS